MKKFYDKYSWLIILLLVGILLLKFLSCEKTKTHIQINLKTEIKRQDSFRTIIKYKDSIRIKELVKWSIIKKEALNDSLPCYSEVKYVIQEADTIIKLDSTEISVLKKQISNDSIIQIKLSDQIQQDSTKISQLNKKLKRAKLIAKLAFITGLGAGGYFGLKISH